MDLHELMLDIAETTALMYGTPFDRSKYEKQTEEIGKVADEIRAIDEV